MNTNFHLLGCLAAALATSAAEPALQVIGPASSGTGMLANGGFEQAQGDTARHWSRSPQGCALVSNQGRDGSAALHVASPAGDGWFGASQSVTLNRPTGPLVVSGWSRAENVGGGTDNNYSLYVDLVYTDGTPLWGQTGNFRCGSHDWERREFVIVPEKPVKSLTLHCLFRDHAGKAWFDDVSVAEMKTSGAAVMFQGVPVCWPDNLTAPAATPDTVAATRDGLGIDLAHGSPAGVRIDQQRLPAGPALGIVARDVAAGSGFHRFTDGACPELDLQLESNIESRPGHLVVQGRLRSLKAQDRAVSLVFALPLAADGWRWGDDIRRSRIISGRGEFINQTPVRCGATGTMSVYPVGAVWNERIGIALALDLGRPAQYRVGYHAGLNQLFLAYDFGLVGESAAFPNSFDFRLVIYRFDPREGFRAAWRKYMEIYPDYFQVRARDQGLWMPFTDVGTVENWQDFGFKFHEGDNNVAWDDAHGIHSFRYTEPMTWWMAMDKDAPRTADEALRLRDELGGPPRPHGGGGGSSDAPQRQLAEVSRVASMADESDAPCLTFRDTPWCNGAVWSLNPNPHLQATPQGDSGPGDRSDSPTNAATVHWSPSIRERLYGDRAAGRLDGEYLDSLEGYVTADLNFRRDHFRDTTVPLTFDTASRRPALFKGLAVYEFTRWIADDVHRMGKLMFANGVPYRFTFLCPWLDVMGTETDWLRDGRYQPAPVAQMDLWRTLSGGKPYLLLMNTDYDRFTPDLVEMYFQRCLFLGMFPGMFSHNAAENPYWQSPRWYNRDRALFRKYIPIIKQIAEAGWQPLTQATCDNDKLLLERFEPDAGGRSFLTVFNDTPAAQAGEIRVDWARLGLDAPAKITELLSGDSLTIRNGVLPLQLPSQSAAALQLHP